MSVDVEVLVQDHKRAIHTVDGIEFHTVPSLISQLRDAIHGGSATDGASAGGKAKLPFQAAAFDLYRVVEEEITELWAGLFRKVPPMVHPETLLLEWAGRVNPDTPVTVRARDWWADGIVEVLVKRIEEYLNPPRLAPIDLPCPSCGERFQERTVDGERVKAAVLYFRRDRDTGDTSDAHCEVCGVVWHPHQFMFFLTALKAGGSNTP